MWPLRRSRVLIAVALLGLLATCATPTPTAVVLRSTPSLMPSPTLSVPTPTLEPSTTSTLAPSDTPPPSSTPVPSSPTAPAPVPTLTTTATPDSVPTVTPTALPTPTPSATQPAVPEWSLRNLLVGPGQPGRLYAHQVLPSADASQPAAARLLISDDSGQTWSPFPGGLPGGAHVDYLTMDYARPDALFATGPDGLYGYGADGWSLLSSTCTRPVVVAFGDPSRLWSLQRGSSDQVMGSFGDYVIASTDGGRTWHDAGFGIFGSLISLAINPTRPAELYVLSAYRSWWYGFYRHRTEGWEQLPMQLPLIASTFGGWTIDGGSGSVYVAFTRDTSRATVPMCCWAQEIWRSVNTDSDNAAEIGWELVHDFGPQGAVALVSSGWSAQGLALYAQYAEIEPEQRCDCSRSPRFRLIVSPDSGQTWRTLPLPVTQGE